MEKWKNGKFYSGTVKNPITFYHIFKENVKEMIGFLGS